jgi:hypothetical protein
MGKDLVVCGCELIVELFQNFPRGSADQYESAQPG